MKSLFLAFFLLSITPIFAQLEFAPNVNYNYQYVLEKTDERFKFINRTLKNDPTNYRLLWEKIEITTKSQFRLDTAPTEAELKHPMFEKYSFYYYTLENRIADINKVIAANPIFQEKNSYYDKADFTFMRGTIYYLMGKNDETIKDYLLALEYLEEAKEQIHYKYKKEKYCIAIAGYYYNLKIKSSGKIDQENRKNNLLQALKYVNIISPLEFIEDFSTIIIDVIPIDPFIAEKSEIIIALKDDNALIRYYMKQLLYQYENYKRFNSESPVYYSNIYMRAANYFQELADLFYKNGNYPQAKYWAEIYINSCPTIEHKPVIYNYDFRKAAYILYHISLMKDFQNYELQINSLLDWFGNIGAYNTLLYKGGINIEKELEKLIAKYPHDGRLYLIDAMNKYEQKIHYRNDEKNYGYKILDILNKAEKLNTDDYRLHYTRALVYNSLINDNHLALQYIDKAIVANKNIAYLFSYKEQIMKELNMPLTESDSNDVRLNKNVQYKDLEAFINTLNK